MSTEEESVSPLFNKMDALLARHRGNARGKEEDILPVLTEVAEEHGPIPVLTEVAVGPASDLMFDPLEFLSPQPVRIEPETVVAELIHPPEKEPEFLDLPLLDLESLLRERAPFGPSGTPVMEPLVGDEQTADLNPVQADQAQNQVQDISAHASASAFDPAQQAEHSAHAVSGHTAAFTQADEPAYELPLASEAADVLTLHWEEADEVQYLPHALMDVAPLATDEVAETTVVVPSADNTATDWSPVAPWWENEPAVDDAETLAASVSVGYVAADLPAAPAVPATELAAISVDWQTDEDTPLELDLDAFREEDAAEPDNLALARPTGAYQAPDVPATDTAPALAPAPTLSLMNEAAISEMTASVAAHLAVDISTEVEQLTRRHFAQMMQTLYGEALTRMIDQVGMELEARLAPRIDALVREELLARGLTNAGTSPASDH